MGWRERIAQARQEASYSSETASVLRTVRANLQKKIYSILAAKGSIDEVERGIREVLIHVDLGCDFHAVLIEDQPEIDDGQKVSQ